MTLFFKERDLVVPGEVVAEGDFNIGEGVFKDGNKLISSVVGLMSVNGPSVSIIALQGSYYPRINDIVIGRVTDTSMYSWKVDISAPWYATLPLGNATERRFDSGKSDLSSIARIGDYLLSRIVSFDRVDGPILTMAERDLGRLNRGRIVFLLPSKIPRFVGRRQSMIEMIEKETNTRIEIGQNGIIWISGRNMEDEMMVEKIAGMVEREAHTTGLTDRVRDFIQAEKTKRGKESVEEPSTRAINQ